MAEEIVVLSLTPEKCEQYKRITKAIMETKGIEELSPAETYMVFLNILDGLGREFGFKSARMEAIDTTKGHQA